MKGYLKYLWLLLPVAVALLPACSEDTESAPELVVCPSLTLPEKAQAFLDSLYPGELPEGLEYLPNMITDEGAYYIMYSDGRTVSFDDAGEWLEIVFPDGGLPAALTEMAGAVREIRQLYSASVVGVARAAYGRSFRLDDGRQVAMAETGRLGFEQLHLHEGPTADELLPREIGAYVREHFPESVVVNVVCPDWERDPDAVWSYRLWLESGTELAFDNDGGLLPRVRNGSPRL